MTALNTPLFSGHPEPHAGLPQHAGVSRLDGAGRALQPAETARAAVGFGLHVGGGRGRIHAGGGINTALPEPRSGDQEEPERKRTPAAFRRHKRPV